MQKLISLDTSVLVDMLSALTADYSRMLRNGTTDKEFAKCSLTIRSIQAEIDSRKQTTNKNSTVEKNIAFTPDYTK
jgi:hypothetical protein